jgi:hypothetical protein
MSKIEISMKRYDHYARPEVFLNLVLIYTLLLTILFFVDSGTLKSIANLFALGVFIYLLVLTLFARQQLILPKRIAIPLFIFFSGVILSFAVNKSSQDMADFIKIAISPLFLYFGFSASVYKINPKIKNKRIALPILLLITVPLATILLDVAAGVTNSGVSTTIGIFANRNNAALYMMCVLALLNSLHLRESTSIALALLIGIGFGTLGIFLATVLSVFVVVSKTLKIKSIILYGCLFGALLSLAPRHLILDRIGVAFASIVYIIDNGLSSIAQLSFRDLYVALDSSDLSLFFRIQHWNEIIEIWFEADIYHQIFGSGVGSAALQTTLRLVPHNDYLRLFFECGVISLFGFGLLQLAIIQRIGRTYAIIPFVAVSIYFASENLINNYLAMIIYFYSAGLIYGAFWSRLSNPKNPQMVLTAPTHP